MRKLQFVYDTGTPKWSGEVTRGEFANEATFTFTQLGSRVTLEALTKADVEKLITMFAEVVGDWE